MVLVQSIFHEAMEMSEAFIKWKKPEGLNFGGNHV
jgi:hypothetical protein